MDTDLILTFFVVYSVLFRHEEQTPQAEAMLGSYRELNGGYSRTPDIKHAGLQNYNLSQPVIQCSERNPSHEDYEQFFIAGFKLPKSDNECYGENKNVRGWISLSCAVFKRCDFLVFSSFFVC